MARLYDDRLIEEYAAYYNNARLHQGFGLRIPDPREDDTSRGVGAFLVSSCQAACIVIFAGSPDRSIECGWIFRAYRIPIPARCGIRQNDA